MKKIKSIKFLCAFCCFLIIYVYMNPKDINIIFASESSNSGHVHNNSVCYDVSPHVHSQNNGCYKSVKGVCNGTWVYNRTVAGVQKSCFSGSCPSCGTFVEGTGTSKRCPNCRSIARLTFDGYELYGYVVWRCSSCGAEKNGTRYECSSGCEMKDRGREIKFAREETYDYYGDEYTGTRHYSTVTKSVLSCSKKVGGFYDADGKPAEPICGKIVTKILADSEKQTIRPGEKINTHATLYMYNGDIVTGYECVTGELNENDFGEEPKIITLKVKSEDYKYFFDKEKNIRVKNALSTDIEVTLIKSFKINIESTKGGKVTYSINDSEPKEKINMGDRITVFVNPDIGYETDAFYVDHVTENENSERTDIVSNGVSNENIDMLIKGTDNDISYTFLMPECNINIVVKFRPKKVKVVFDPCGGDIRGSSNDITGYAYYGKKLCFSLKFPEKPGLSGYSFLGWYDNNQIPYGETSVCTDTDMLFLHAEWAANTKESIVVEYEDEIPRPRAKNILGFNINYDTFWRYSEYRGNGTGKNLAKNEIMKSVKDIDFYGHWDACEYTIFFDPTEGEMDEEEKIKKVLYHAKIGELPFPKRAGYIFCGWKRSEEYENDYINSEDICYFTSDITLYAVWQKDSEEKEAFVDAGIYAINNVPINEGDLDDEETLICTDAGDLISCYIRGQLSENVVLPVQVNLTPIYEIKNDDDFYEKVHVLSTGTVYNKIMMFYERGAEVHDAMEFEINERYISENINYVLNHLSYAVREENYESMINYSTVNTLSGYEEFFEKNAIIRISFDLKIVDKENDVIFDDVIFAVDSKLR